MRQSVKSYVIFPHYQRSSLDDASGARSPTLISEEGRPTSGGPYERYCMKYMCILWNISYVSFDSLRRHIVYVILNCSSLKIIDFGNCTFHMHVLFHSSKFIVILWHYIIMMVSSIASLLFIIFQIVLDISSPIVFKISYMSCNFNVIIIHD